MWCLSWHESALTSPLKVVEDGWKIRQELKVMPLYDLQRQEPIQGPRCMAWKKKDFSFPTSQNMNKKSQSSPGKGRKSKKTKSQQRWIQVSNLDKLTLHDKMNRHKRTKVEEGDALRAGQQSQRQGINQSKKLSFLRQEEHYCKIKQGEVDKRTKICDLSMNHEPPHKWWIIPLFFTFLRQHKHNKWYISFLEGSRMIVFGRKSLL